MNGCPAPSCSLPVLHLSRPVGGGSAGKEQRPSPALSRAGPRPPSSWQGACASCADAVEVISGGEGRGSSWKRGPARAGVVVAGLDSSWGTGRSTWARLVKGSSYWRRRGGLDVRLRAAAASAGAAARRDVWVGVSLGISSVAAVVATRWRLCVCPLFYG